MLIKCPHCAYGNPEEYVFCHACGKPLRLEAESVDGSSQPNTPQESSFHPSGPMPQPSTSTSSFLPQIPQVPQAPIIPLKVEQPLPPVVQMGTISRDITISKVHAFAGYGLLVTHQSWFLRESAAAAINMLATSFDILHKRSILGLSVEPRNLQDYSSQTEVRHYLMLRRGVATVFLYIAPAGYDLYISRATTVLTSIDPFRCFILIALMVIGVLLFIVFPVSIPIWLGLIWFFTISFRYWLRERDFWFYLRKRDLNDFQLDDIALMEQVVDDTLRVAAKQNEIDADKLVPPTKGYQHERRIRAV